MYTNIVLLLLYSVCLFCIQSASDDLLAYLSDFTKEAVKEREVNLSAPIYLLSSVIKGFGRSRAGPEIAKVDQINSMYFIWS